ncbi:hypothetical protein Tco_0087049 [Tanacetum coccineum]
MWASVEGWFVEVALGHAPDGAGVYFHSSRWSMVPRNHGDTIAQIDEEMFDVNVLDGEEVFVAEQEVAIKDVNNEVNVVEEVVEVINTAKQIIDATTVSVATTTTATIKTIDDINFGLKHYGNKTYKTKEERDKGKGILIERGKPINKKDLIRLNEENALNLQAEFDEEERLTRENAKKEEEANIALIETWDDIQAKIDADHQLAKRMQAQEQEELYIEEKATLFQHLLEKRRKHFATKRAKEKRNKPPTKA